MRILRRSPQRCARSARFDWIVFASRHAVAAVLGALPAAPPDLKVAAIGKATAQVLRQRGWPVDLVPDEASAAALVAAFGARVAAGGGRASSIRPARARCRRSPRACGSSAPQVAQVEAYRTEGAALDVADCRDWIARDGIAAVTFASPSAVDELAARSAPRTSRGC